MRKIKKTCKKAKGLKARLKREEFLDRLKNPAKYISVSKDYRGADEILAKIRELAGIIDQPVIIAKQQPKRNITLDKLTKILGMIK